VKPNYFHKTDVGEPRHGKSRTVLAVFERDRKLHEDNFFFASSAHHHSLRTAITAVQVSDMNLSLVS